ncbi:MAG: PD-(D/E)XK nuclease family protein [Candidatus Aenigmatarchaeota archaeon]
MPVYSNSRLSCFEQCPLKYKYEYVERIERPVEETVEQFLGSRVHEALEKLYRDLKFQKEDTLEELLDFYNSQWKKNWNQNIILVRKEYTQENYRKMGEKYITNYYKRYYPFNQSVTIALEQKLTVSLDSEGKYRITGRIDRLSSNGDGCYEIHDYKTSFSMTPHSILETERQLPLYAIAVKHHYHDAEKILLTWHFLSADKSVTITKTDEQLQKLRKEIIELIDKIESSDFIPRKSELCDWCQFRTICPEWAHIAKVESLSPNEYLKEPGVKLVNEYAELKAKRDKLLAEIDPKLEKIKEALVQYAEKNNLKAVAGSDYIARVWMAEVVKVPNKDEPGREEVESIVKRLGLWKDVSVLDTFALSKIIQNNDCPKEFIDKLMPYLRKEKLSRIYLRAMENEREEE